MTGCCSLRYTWQSFNCQQSQYEKHRKKQPNTHRGDIIRRLTHNIVPLCVYVWTQKRCKSFLLLFNINLNQLVTTKWVRPNQISCITSTNTVHFSLFFWLIWRLSLHISHVMCVENCFASSVDTEWIFGI